MPIYFLVGDYHRVEMDNKAPDADANEFLSDAQINQMINDMSINPNELRARCATALKALLADRNGRREFWTGRGIDPAPLN